MISALATAAAAEQVAQERRRRQLQLLSEDGQQQKPSPFPASKESSSLDEAESAPVPQTFDTQEGPTQPCAAPAGSPDVLGNCGDEAGEGKAEALRASAAPVPSSAISAGQQTKPHLQLQQQLLPESAQRAPVLACGPNPGAARVTAAAPAAASVTAAAAATAAATSTNPVARLVDAILYLTNDRYGASLRVLRRTVADEVVQGVAEAADESERAESVVMQSAAGAEAGLGVIGRGPVAHLAITSSAAADCVELQPSHVEEVYQYDLMEDNPNWKSFLTSSIGEKSKVWKRKREEARGGYGRALYSEPRRLAYMTLSYPDFSRTAYWLGVFIVAIILLNTATFCIESVPRYQGTSLYGALTVVDYVCLGIFTAEYVARLLTCPDVWRFLRSLSNLIDLVAILPFYVELCVTGTSTEAFQTRVVRLLRVFRVLRIVKTMPRLRHLALVAETLRDSLEVLIMLACLLLVLLVVFGTIVFFVEPATFDSIPQAMYYAQTTLTTTGYGDLYPVTPWGRFVAGGAMLLCMVVVSLPIALIGGNFSEKWADYKAFKKAVDRSSRVYPTAQELRGALEGYEAVLDDVMRQLHRCEEASEKQLREMREDIAAARGALLRSGATDAPPPAAMDAGGGDAAATAGGGRFRTVAKAALRHARKNSMGTAMRRTGSYSNSQQLQLLPPEPSSGGSGANLIGAGLPDGSGGGGGSRSRSGKDDSVSGGSAAAVVAAANGSLEPPSSSSGAASPRHHPDLRSAAALPFRATAAAALPPPLQQQEQQLLPSAREAEAVDAEEADSETGAGRAGGDGESGLQRGGGGGRKATATTAVRNARWELPLAPPPSAGGADPFLSAAKVAAAALAPCSSPSIAIATPSVIGIGGTPQQELDTPAGENESSDDDFAPQLPLPPPPPPAPAAPPPSAPPPATPAPPPHSHPIPVTAASTFTSGPGAAASSLGVSGLSLQITRSIALFLGRKNGAAAAAEEEASAGGAAASLPEPAVLDRATELLQRAAAACRSGRELWARHGALAAQAHILRSDDVPTKLEKLDEQYRQVRGWQEELGPMAERMWTLRDALDDLAWALQEGMPYTDSDGSALKYKPTNAAERAAADNALGAPPRRRSGSGWEAVANGIARQGA